jgi:hypothetical protein
MHLLKITRPLAALTLFCLQAGASHGEEVLAPAKQLAQAAMLLPPPQREEVRHKALAIVLLAEYGRLLPSGLSPGQWEALEKVFLEGSFDDAVRSQQAASMPPADTVRFDGGRLDGGGFARTDNIIGTNGRPIALDRRLPTRLIPLNQGEANRLHQAASVFSATPEADSVRERTDALYRARLGNHMVDDGIFCRLYAGRTDDLYYRLVQEHPRAPSEMNFYAISESLPGRNYHPLTGIGSPVSVPSPWFSVSEILSGGGLLAVEDFKNRNRRADVRNPFFGFAARVLPFLGPSLENSQPGEELNVSKDVIRRAIQSPHRFTPKPVEPIFSDPSHFFGCLLPRFLCVARRMSRAEMAEEFRKIDFGTPLPDVPTEPIGNEVLTEPSKWTKSEFFQELPALLELDSSTEHNPNTDLFAGPQEDVGPQPPPAAPEAVPETPSNVLVQTLPNSAASEVASSSTPPAPAPPPAPPLPSSMPLVAAMPSPNPPAQGEKPATPAPEPVAAPAALAAAFPISHSPFVSSFAASLLRGGPNPAFAISHFAFAPQARNIVFLAETEFPGIDMATLAVSSPPLSSPDLISIEPSPQIGVSVFPERTQPAPLPGPLLVENITPTKLPRPSAPMLPRATPQMIVLKETMDEPPRSARIETPTSLTLDFSPSLPESPSLLAALAPSSRNLTPDVGSLLMETGFPAPGTELASTAPSRSAEPSSPQPIPSETSSALSLQPSASSPVPQPIPSEAPGAHYLAVITPGISASTKYLNDLAVNDAVLSKNAATLNRVNCYLQWLNSAVEPVESYLASSSGLATAPKNELQAAAAVTGDELNTLLDRRKSLLKERERLLSERGQLRSLIEGEPLRLSTAKLDALLGRPIEVSNLVALNSSRYR